MIVIIYNFIKEDIMMNKVKGLICFIIKKQD